jgi:hypothetical protein
LAAIEDRCHFNSLVISPASYSRATWGHIHIRASIYAITPGFATVFRDRRNNIPPAAGHRTIVFEKMHVFCNKPDAALGAFD